MCLFSVTITPNVQSYRTLGVTLVSESMTGRGAGLQFYQPVAAAAATVVVLSSYR